jgi:hypothetical protein
MLGLKGIFQYIFEGIKQSKPYSVIEKVLSPQLPEMEQRQLLSLYHDVKEIYNKGEQIANLYIFDRVPQSLGTVSPWEWKKANTMRAKISGFDTLTQRYVEQYVTVSSDRPQTKEEWLSLLEEAGSSLFGRYDINVEKITDFQYFVRKK